MKQQKNNKKSLVVDCNDYDLEDGHDDDDEAQITDQTPLHLRNRLARLEKLKQIKDDLDKEIEYIVIDDSENEIEETSYNPPPLVHPMEIVKTSNKMLEKVGDEIGVLVKRPFIQKKDRNELKKWVK